MKILNDKQGAFTGILVGLILLIASIIIISAVLLILGGGSTEEERACYEINLATTRLSESEFKASETCRTRVAHVTPDDWSKCDAEFKGNSDAESCAAQQVADLIWSCWSMGGSGELDPVSWNCFEVGILPSDEASFSSFNENQLMSVMENTINTELGNTYCESVPCSSVKLTIGVSVGTIKVSFCNPDNKNPEVLGCRSDIGQYVLVG